MSKFYGQVFGAAKTTASRRGHSDITVSAQSFDGSVITSLRYDRDGNLVVDIMVSPESSAYGGLVFSGTLAEFVDRLGGR